jgi:hypothetical protein
MSVMGEIPDTKTQQVLDVIHSLNIKSLDGLRKFARHASMQRRAAEGGLEQRYIDAIVREYGIPVTKGQKTRKTKKEEESIKRTAADGENVDDGNKTQTTTAHRRNNATGAVAASVPESSNENNNEDRKKAEKKSKRASARLNKKKVAKSKSRPASAIARSAGGEEPDSEQAGVLQGSTSADVVKPLETKMTKLQLLQQKQKRSKRTSSRSTGSTSSLASTRSAMASIRNLPVRAVDAVVGGVDALWLSVNTSVPK